jgi:hypothetical protein
MGIIGRLFGGEKKKAPVGKTKSGIAEKDTGAGPAMAKHSKDARPAKANGDVSGPKAAAHKRKG